MTWFVDPMLDVTLGAAVPAGIPNRGSVLAALRASVLRRAPYGPAGGIPGVVCIDRGKDFLSATVQEALGAFAVRVVALPAYTPYLKGTVESINGAVEEMLFAGLPRYTHRQTQINGAPVDPDQPALTLEAFVAEVLAWVDWWNTRHRIEALGRADPVATRADAVEPGLCVARSFGPMTPENVLRVIPAFHPVWENADPEVISFADAHAGHGNSRSWAKLTAHAARAL